MAGYPGTGGVCGGQRRGYERKRRGKEGYAGMCRNLSECRSQAN